MWCLWGKRLALPVSRTNTLLTSLGWREHTVFPTLWSPSAYAYSQLIHRRLFIFVSIFWPEWNNMISDLGVINHTFLVFYWLCQKYLLCSGIICVYECLMDLEHFLIMIDVSCCDHTHIIRNTKGLLHTSHWLFNKAYTVRSFSSVNVCIWNWFQTDYWKVWIRTSLAN